jgi:hypothetical protein
MTKRWRYWLSAAVIFGVVAILAVIAVPCENLRIVVANGSRERAAIQIAIRYFRAESVRIVWTGTAKAGETREIPLLVASGHHLLRVVIQFPDRSEPKFIEDRAFFRSHLFGGDTYNFRFTDENLRSSRSPPELSVALEPDIDSLLSAFGHIAEVLYDIMRCQDCALRQNFRRWVAEPPFSLNPEGQRK